MPETSSASHHSAKPWIVTGLFTFQDSSPVRTLGFVMEKFTSSK